MLDLIMWYPTLGDVLEVYERVAGRHPSPPESRDEAAVDRLVVAPQWAGNEEKTVGSMASKAAAILSCATEEDKFPERGAHVGYALAVTLLEKNGFDLQADLTAVRDVALQLRDGDLQTDGLADWITLRLERKDRSLNARRILTALDRMTRVIDRLKKHPDGERLAKQLDAAGHAICTEVIDAFEPGEQAQERILHSYPAVDERWGTVIRLEGFDGEDE
jgi:prophage maintenance system killer protein